MITIVYHSSFNLFTELVHDFVRYGLIDAIAYHLVCSIPVVSLYFSRLILCITMLNNIDSPFTHKSMHGLSPLDEEC